MITAIKHFSIVFTVLILGIGIYLLLVGRPLREFLVLALVGILGGAVMFNYDQIQSFTAKWSGGAPEIVVQMREIRDDVYAKADEVQRMGETITEQIAYALSRVGRFAPSGEDLDRDLLESRDRIIVTLDALGSTKKRIAEIVSPIENAVELDLASEVASSVRRQLNEKNVSGTQGLQGQLIKKLLSSDGGEAEKVIRPQLEELGAWNREVELQIERFEEFRRTRRLPEVSRLDE